MEENGINSTLSSNPALSTLLKNGTSRHDDRPFVVWISSLIVVTAILIIIFNTLVVFTFSRQYHHMDNKTVFYVFIAISDFFAGVYLLTNTLWYVKTPMHFSFGMCMFLHTFGIILFYVSAYHILALTIFQYIEIQFPFRGKWMCSKSFYVKICCGLWILISFAFITPALLLSKEKYISECSILSVFGEYHKLLNFKTFIFYTVFLVLQAFFSIILLLKIRAVLCKAASSPREDVHSTNCKVDHASASVEDTSSSNHRDVDVRSARTENDESNTRKRARDRYVTSAKTLFIYLFVYMVCTLPIMCMVFKDMMFRFDSFHNRKITISLGAFAMMTSMVNPILYFRRFQTCVGCT